MKSGSDGQAYSYIYSEPHGFSKEVTLKVGDQDVEFKLSSSIPTENGYCGYYGCNGFWVIATNINGEISYTEPMPE